ncbi:hypothetical protein AB205_0037290 [Aquarana catesbeiana]|uniref:Uncharacterized protein n=1 Tax=Aquarana catesbeiana TaxID=8400 RepID=A0A2G9RZN3_AQUCT|nr:hypothetical protein AB205_0037290 [Aquarana catesbeiana]
MVEIVTTTGERDVVDPGHFTSESAQILIGEVMGCNRDLENIQKNINDVKNKMKNIIKGNSFLFCGICNLKIFYHFLPFYRKSKC